ncbi:methyltransferase domain-containing protein [Streptomyces phaeochromogenes]|uniref:methyltransferase domain-containing protein n=1 Tax=Streptomyces phaeochromogenes TaxID=1923 RepID=UPI0033E3DA61
MYVTDSTAKADQDGHSDYENGPMTTNSSGNAFVRIDDDSADVQRRVVNYLDRVAAHHEMQRVRSVAFETLAPAEGEHLLDVGCGLGEIARQLAVRVGGGGSVAAVDLSEQAISVAQTRHDGGSATYAVGDITALDFPDNHFDAARCERVLQHVQDPDRVIKELARVTRPGGRVCVIDTDWSSSVGDGFDHLDEVISSLAARDHNFAAGRTVRSRMVTTGLQRTTAFPVTLRFTSPADAAVLSGFFNRNFMRDRLSAELFNRFFASVDRSVDRGDFLFAFTMWICLGQVGFPDQPSAFTQATLTRADFNIYALQDPVHGGLNRLSGTDEVPSLP